MDRLDYSSLPSIFLSSGAACADSARRLKIALIADDLTRLCLSHEAAVCNLTPFNHRWLLRLWKPDLVLVESAWNGYRRAWKYRIAAYPGHPMRNNRALARMVACARELGIPTVFWNKEDGVHFDRFIDSAGLFEHIFTTDENCIPRYRAAVGPEVTVTTLMFAVQPRFHNFTGFNFRHRSANFIGSYSSHTHAGRRAWQHMMFSATHGAGLGLMVHDRNSSRKSDSYRFPAMPGMQVRPALPHARTAGVYKEYLVSLNVNTVEDSATMFSRRLVEALACGGIVVTSPSVAVERHFSDFCHVAHDAQQAADLFARLRHGPSRDDLERAEAGARHVLARHTWARRLEEIRRVVGLH
jgi:hypothetical protein